MSLKHKFWKLLCFNWQKNSQSTHNYPDFWKIPEKIMIGGSPYELSRVPYYHKAAMKRIKRPIMEFNL